MEDIDVAKELMSLEKLVHTIQQLSLSKNIDSVMKIVRTVARELTGADGATFVLRDNEMCFYAEEDAISPLWKGSRFPMEICISGWSMINKKSVIIPDIYQDDRIPHDAYRPTFVKSLVMVPIRRIDPIGAIGNYWAEHHVPTAQEVGFLQALADITAVSIENINIQSKLEEKLEERELMLTQLEKQKEQLKEFNHIISHNLRAPISNLLLINDMILSGETVQEKLFLLEKQNKVVNSLSETFEELVDAAQVKMDFDVEKNYIEMNLAVEKVESLLQGEIIKTKAKIYKDFSEAKTLYYPRQYFDSILLNLLSNSIRYHSPERTPEIMIKSWKEAEWIYLSVEDNGLGIDLSQQGDNIFKLRKTFHAHPQAKGFGLFITKTQIESVGGSISVESNENKGSKFTVQLIKEK